MYDWPENWWQLHWRAVVYYARAAHAFSAGIKCLHYRLISTIILILIIHFVKMNKVMDKFS